MPTRDNVTLSAQFIGVLNSGDVSAMRQLVTPDFVSHFAGADMNLEQFIGFNQAVMAAFADFTFHIEDTVAAGDKVVVRLTATGTHTGVFQGHQPTNKSFRISGLSMFLLHDGKFIEQWANPDQLSMMRQLGLV